ncbi:hypothetical protein K490DRAFT_63724 [Saccharata proteae CBS 121410]|uniref:Uncharacterized protein n=1 Tax=Saccharata proteae CBS 121410 TaxID=1314787 RepID=A0A6A5YE19_9PEZI|nr:hypothetical protein K490DRAFT_63724 [Saccharata proteae CBS 121410]
MVSPHTVFEGQTLYEGNVYMSFSSVWAIDKCLHVVNSTSGYTNVILPVPSTDVYSVRSGWQNPGTVFAGYSFDFDDLATVQSSAWYSAIQGNDPWGSYTVNSRAAVNGKTMDYGDRSSTILQEAYAPLLMMPPQIRDLDPGWADCDLYINGLQDEPVLITATADLLPVETTPAVPASSALSATPAPTGI